jgi:hypothetical protein
MHSAKDPIERLIHALGTICLAVLVLATLALGAFAIDFLFSGALWGIDALARRWGIPLYMVFLSPLPLCFLIGLISIIGRKLRSKDRTQ